VNSDTGKIGEEIGRGVEKMLTDCWRLECEVLYDHLRVACGTAEYSQRISREVYCQVKSMVYDRLNSSVGNGKIWGGEQGVKNVIVWHIFNLAGKGPTWHPRFKLRKGSKNERQQK
jgi:hypothetical protein